MDLAVWQESEANPFLTRLIRGDFVVGQVRMLEVLLVAACINVPCGAGKTCNEEGVCVDPPVVRASTLPIWNGEAPRPIDGGVDAIEPECMIDEDCSALVDACGNARCADGVCIFEDVSCPAPASECQAVGCSRVHAQLGGIVVDPM